MIHKRTFISNECRRVVGFIILLLICPALVNSQFCDEFNLLINGSKPLSLRLDL